MILDKAKIVNYDCNCRFIVQATINMIVNYDRKTFIIQATGLNNDRKKFLRSFVNVIFTVFIIALIPTDTANTYKLQRTSPAKNISGILFSAMTG
jgi:hypothetical protein